MYLKQNYYFLLLYNPRREKIENRCLINKIFLKLFSEALFKGTPYSIVRIYKTRFCFAGFMHYFCGTIQTSH